MQKVSMSLSPIQVAVLILLHLLNVSVNNVFAQVNIQQINATASTNSIQKSDNITVVSSIYPVQQITNAIVGKSTELVVDSYLSPHKYNLKPQDVEKVLHSDLFIWVGEAILPQLTKLVERRKQYRMGTTITIDTLAGLDKHKLNDLNGDDGHQHIHSSSDEFDKSENTYYDPHLWLSTHNAKVIARAIATKVGELNPHKKEEYQKNLEKFITEVDMLKKEIIHQFYQIKLRDFYVLHDAYGYFEEEFGVRHKGSIRSHSGQLPRVRDFLQLKKEIAVLNGSCILSEPQFKSSLITSLVSDNDNTVGILDPIGYQKNQFNSDIHTNGYTKIIKNIADSLLKNCKLL